MLSQMAKTFTSRFLLTRFTTDVKAGAKNGIQYRNMRISGLNSMTLFAVLRHEHGLIELKTRSLFSWTAGVPFFSWDVPGKNIFGYWVVKLRV
jgi:hypothetical protein